MVVTTSTTGEEVDDDFIFGLDFSKLDASRVVFDDDAGVVAAELTTKQARVDDYKRRYADLIQQMLPEAPCSNTVTIKKLFLWAGSKGAFVENLNCRKDQFGGTGLYLNSEYISKGSVVAILPRSLRIGQNFACDRLGLPTCTPDLAALSLLLADGLSTSERLSSCTTGISLYAQCLPRSCRNAVFMSPIDQTYWKGRGYNKALSQVRDQAKSCVQYIQHCVMSLDQQDLDGKNGSLTTMVSTDSVIWWAIAMVQSRTHCFGSRKCRWLTPIFDFCNHSDEPNCRLEGDSEGNLILRAVKLLQNGEEITIDYQIPDDAKLVATYGFSLLHPGPPNAGSSTHS